MKLMPSWLKQNFKKQWAKKRFRRYFRLLIFCLIIILAVNILSRWLGSPAYGVIKDPSGKTHNISSEPIKDKRYDGQYISISYPGDYQKVDSKLSGSYLEVARFAGPGGSASLISIGVLRESVSNDSSLTYRRQHLGIYHEEPAKNNEIAFVSAATGFERTVFVSHNDLVASISLTDANGNNLTELSKKIVQSLHWK